MSRPRPVQPGPTLPTPGDIALADDLAERVAAEFRAPDPFDRGAFRFFGVVRREREDGAWLVSVVADIDRRTFLLPAPDWGFRRAEFQVGPERVGYALGLEAYGLSVAAGGDAARDATAGLVADGLATLVRQQWPGLFERVKGGH